MARARALWARARSIVGLPPAVLGAVGGAGGPGAHQSLVALGLNSTTSLVAGAILGGLTEVLERYPGLLVIIPAAIGLRGHVFGAFGNRISTFIHAGEFRLTARPGSVLGQTVLAAGVLTLAMTLLIAVLAVLVSRAVGLGETIALSDLILVSMVGGMLASVPVLGATLGLAAGSVRYGWDLDNVNAPIVTTLGDVVTLPALALATGLVSGQLFGELAAYCLAAGTVAVLLVAWRSRLPLLRRVVRESTPIVTAAVVVSILAGVMLEGRAEAFTALPALLVLLPAHLASGGALGGILSGRLSTKLYLGVAQPTLVPSRAARPDLAFIAAVGLMVYGFNGAAAHVVAGALGMPSPGLALLVATALIGGVLTVFVVLVMAYYGTIVAARMGLDPDSYGIPIVTSTVDLVGVLTLVLAIAVLGLA